MVIFFTGILFYFPFSPSSPFLSPLLKDVWVKLLPKQKWLSFSQEFSSIFLSLLCFPFFLLKKTVSGLNSCQSGNLFHRNYFLFFFYLVFLSFFSPKRQCLDTVSFSPPFLLSLSPFLLSIGKETLEKCFFFFLFFNSPFLALISSSHTYLGPG